MRTDRNGLLLHQRGSCGEAEGPFAAAPPATLVLHLHREVIHHGAGTCLLRDLYAHREDR